MRGKSEKVFFLTIIIRYLIHVAWFIKKDLFILVRRPIQNHLQLVLTQNDTLTKTGC